MKLDFGTEYMIVEVIDGVGWVTFNNPERRNAVKFEMWEAIPKIFDTLVAQNDVRCIVMKGAGDKSFVAGADISEFKEKRSTPEQVTMYNATSAAAYAAIENCEKPLIAMIRGFCIGGGLAVALSADIRIAADNTVYAVPAARLGLGYRYPGMKRLVNLVGPAYAKEIFFTARKFNAEEAWRMGLVNKVVGLDELDAAVAEYAGMIAENAPLTVAAANFAVQTAIAHEADRDFAKLDEMVEACFASEDYKEGQTAFMEKRKPVFQGR
ncbi:MAG: enoyl-CoA hydratase [Rhodospirillales bacterium]